MNNVMYLIVNTGLNMGRGKIAGQVGHGVVLSMEISDCKNVIDWRLKNNQTKIVLSVEDNSVLEDISKKLYEKNIKSVYVVDCGKTEIQEGSISVLAVEITDKDKLSPILKDYKLLV